MDMSRLPSDLMIHILSRLTVKTLSKLRCVCKAWLQLISDPLLLHLHSHRSTQNPLLCFSSLSSSDSQTDALDTLNLSCMDIEGNVIHRFNKSLVDYCCDTDMLPTRFELVCFFEYNQIYVCNPSTQEFITISEPLPPNVDDLNSVGFGYIPSTKEYKLVRIFFRYWELPPFHVGCDVLTLGSCSWRAVKDPPFNTTTCRPAFVNGAIHWTINPDIPSYSDDETEEFGLVPHPDAILAFDVDTEEFRLVPHPENLYDPRETNDDIGLVELEGLLCLAVVVHRKRDMNIWMLTDYKNHVWVKEYSINLNTLDPCKTLGDFTARDIRGGKILIEDYIARLDYYDLQSKSFKRFEIDNMITSPQFSFYVESFRSLRSRK